METGIALCRHSLTQFGYASVRHEVDMWLLCHDTKSKLHEVAAGLRPDRVKVYERYDTNNLVEFDAGGLIEATGCRGIIALSEVDVLRAARLRSHYDLPGMKYEQARLFRDKVLMKETLERAGVAVPRCLAVETGHDLRIAAETLGYPFVVKPRMGGGSVGAHVVASELELRALLADGLQANFYTPAHMEAEEFVEGDLCHVDGLVLDGQTVLQTVSRYRSDVLAFGTPLSSGMVETQSPRSRRLADFTGQVLTALGLLGGAVDSYFHCEVFDHPDGPVLCEVAARPGGLGVVDQLDAYYGVSSFEMLLSSTFLGTSPRPSCTPREGDLVGWVGIPVSCDPAIARSLVPTEHYLCERLYQRPEPGRPQMSSVDVNGVLVIRGGSESDLDAVMCETIEQLIRVAS